MAFEIGAAVARIKGDNTQLKATVKESKGVMSNFGDQVQATAKGAAIGFGILAAGLTAFAKKASDSTVDYVKGVNRLSREIGETTEKTSALLYVTKRMGIDAEAASGVFGIFSKRIAEAAGNSDEARLKQEELRNKIKQVKQELAQTTDEIKLNGDKTGDLRLKMESLNIDLSKLNLELTKSDTPFQRLGINLTDVNGKQKTFATVLGEVADKIKGMPNGVEKTALAMELFGRSGKDMLPILNLGSEGIARMEEDAKRLGLTITKDNIKAVKDYSQAQKDLADSQQALNIQVGTKALPLQTAFLQEINKLVGGLAQQKGAVGDVTTGILAYGGPVAGAISATAGFAGSVGGALPLMEKMGFSLALLARMGVVGLVIAAIAGAVYVVIQAFGGLDNVMNGLTNAYNKFLKPVFDNLWATIQTQLIPALSRLWEKVGPILIPVLQQLAVILGTVIIAHIILTATVLTWLIQRFSDFINWMVSAKGAAQNFATAVGYFIGGVPGAIIAAMSGVSNALISPFREAFNWIKSNVDAVTKKLKDLSPFTRHSPSLVDLVRAGTGEIKKSYKGMFTDLRGMAFPLTPKFGPLASQGALLAGGLGGGGNGVTTNFHGDVIINKDADADYVMQRLTRGQEVAMRGGTV